MQRRNLSNEPLFPEDEHAPEKVNISTLTEPYHDIILISTDNPTTAALLDHLNCRVLVGQHKTFDIDTVKTLPLVNSGYSANVSSITFSNVGIIDNEGVLSMMLPRCRIPAFATI